MLETEKIISEFDFFNIKTEQELKTEIADLVYLVVTCDYELISKIENKIWLADDLYKIILPSLKGDLEPGMFFENLVACAKKLYNVDTVEKVLNICKEYINKAFDELGLIIVNDFADVFELLEVTEKNIIFPLKWFSPAIYKSMTEFLKTFNCERCKIKKQTAFANNGEFTIEQIIKIGKDLKGVSLSTKFDFFPTPQELVKKVQELADIKENDLILEPSAGTGNLIAGLNEKNITCIELNPILSTILKEKKYNVKNISFEEFETEQKFDKVIMNPPFSKRLDAKHIVKAFEMLKNGGELVAIHSVGILTAEDKASKNFRTLCNQYMISQERISAGAFSESAKGTNIETCITKLIKE